MFRIAAVIVLAGSPAFANVDTCPTLRASIEADHAASADRAIRAGLRRLDLFAMSSRATDASALSDVASQAGDEMAAILLAAEIERRAAHAKIDVLCSR